MKMFSCLHDIKFNVKCVCIKFTLDFPVGRDPHCFLLKDLFQLIYTVDEVECPVHRGKVKLEQLVIIISSS